MHHHLQLTCEERYQICSRLQASWWPGCDIHIVASATITTQPHESRTHAGYDPNYLT